MSIAHEKNTRRTTYLSSSVFTEEDWEYRAACGGQSYLFDILEPKKGDNVHEVKRENAENFELAKKICDTCPVMEQCESDATAEDFYHTFRAGRIPRGFSPRSAGRPKTTFKPDPELGSRKCSHGHVGHYVYRDNGVRKKAVCLECHRTRGREAWAKRPKNPPKPTVPLETRVCPKGHKGAYKMYDKPRCSECRKYANR